MESILLVLKECQFQLSIYFIKRFYLDVPFGLLLSRNIMNISLFLLISQKAPKMTNYLQSQEKPWKTSKAAQVIKKYQYKTSIKIEKQAMS